MLYMQVILTTYTISVIIVSVVLISFLRKLVKSFGLYENTSSNQKNLLKTLKRVIHVKHAIPSDPSFDEKVVKRSFVDFDNRINTLIEEISTSPTPEGIYNLPHASVEIDDLEFPSVEQEDSNSTTIIEYAN